jgi:hypothetical protein
MKLFIMQMYLPSSYIVSLVQIFSTSCSHYGHCMILPKVLLWNYLNLFIFIELMGMEVQAVNRLLLIAKAQVQS